MYIGVNSLVYWCFFCLAYPRDNPLRVVSYIDSTTHGLTGDSPLASLTTIIFLVICSCRICQCQCHWCRRQIDDLHALGEWAYIATDACPSLNCADENFGLLHVGGDSCLISDICSGSFPIEHGKHDTESRKWLVVMVLPIVLPKDTAFGGRFGEFCIGLVSRGHESTQRTLSCCLGRDWAASWERIEFQVKDLKGHW